MWRKLMGLWRMKVRDILFLFLVEWCAIDNRVQNSLLNHHIWFSMNLLINTYFKILMKRVLLDMALPGCLVVNMKMCIYIFVMLTSNGGIWLCLKSELVLLELMGCWHPHDAEFSKSRICWNQNLIWKMWGLLMWF